MISKREMLETWRIANNKENDTMDRFKYFCAFVICHMLINKTFAWAPTHYHYAATTIIIVSVLCIANAVLISKRCLNAGIYGNIKKAVIISSLIPIVYFVPFLYTMFKPSINKESDIK